MNFYLHISIHIFFALLAGLIVWRIYKKPVPSIIGGLLGGFLVDLDHFIDYFIVFGWHFNYHYFVHGYEFIKSGKIHLLFHGWEYVIILLGIAFFIRKKIKLKSFILALAIGLFFHLVADVAINEGMNWRTYFIIDRVKNSFNIEKVVTPEHYQKYLREKSEINI